MKSLSLLIFMSSFWSSLGLAYTSACVTKTVISAICDSPSGPVARADVYELIQNPEFKDSSDPERICKAELYDAFFSIWMPTENGYYERVVNREMFGPKKNTIYYI